MLPGFDDVFSKYIALVSHEIKRIHTSFKLDDHDMFKFFDTYQLSVEAMKQGSWLETSSWGRQVGASAFAIALLVGNPSVYVVNSTLRMTKSMTRRVCDVFHEERVFAANKCEAYNHPSFKHTRLLTTTTWRHDLLCRRPELVIFDSDTARVKNIQDEVDDVHHIFKCGVLVFKSKLR